jgi:hypothetical protein
MASNYPTDYQNTMNAVNTGVNAAGVAMAPSTGGLSIGAAMITSTVINVVGGILQGLGQERVKQPVPFSDKERAYWYDYYNRLAKRRDRAVHFATMALGAEPGTFDFDIDEGFKQTLNEYYDQQDVSINDAIAFNLSQDSDYITAGGKEKAKMRDDIGVSLDTMNETPVTANVIKERQDSATQEALTAFENLSPEEQKEIGNRIFDNLGVSEENRNLINQKSPEQLRTEAEVAGSGKNVKPREDMTEEEKALADKGKDISDKTRESISLI